MRGIFRRLCLLGLVATLALVATGDARAELGAVSPELGRSLAELRSARGAEVYAAIRELWRLWDRADPTQVEEGLRGVADDGGVAPAVRVYARLLVAYARRRRGDLDGAQAVVSQLGFVGRFMTLGPFDDENKGGFGRPFEPENELFAAVEPGRTYEGKERPIRWRTPPASGSYGWFDFGEFIRPREHVCAYASTWIRAKAGTRSPRPISLWFGAAGSFKLFWNGEEVLEDAGYRELDAERFATTVTLGPGLNRVVAKVCAQEEAPKFALRIGDERGAPDLAVEIVADVETSAAYAQAHPQKSAPLPDARKEAKDKKGAVPTAKVAAGPIPHRGSLEGPMQTLGRAAEGAGARPEALETFARYLATTGGDARPEHKARDLASRAAEAQPSIKRLLLAGKLAEDRNQEREWLEKAKAAAGRNRNDLDILLVEAQLAQSGSNWRDAVPIYEKILAVDPDHVGATLGRVELYIEAGLKRTALATLEHAISRQPSCLALLRAYSAQLRALGRDTEAAEVEVRYSAFRFDDTGFLSQQVELAVARRDAAGAERWLDRFLRVEPESAYGRGIAARTYRALGQPERALAAYQRALALAPEDIATLRALSDLYGMEGKRDEQLRLLRQILAISPQNKEVREYVEHIEPPKPRADEAYAWASDRFLPMRAATGSRSYPKRTLRNLTVTTVFPNGLASRFRQVVYQPLTDEAAASGREYAFEYQADRQTVTLRAAKVYRADGKVDESIESGEGSANNPAIAMYTSTRTFYVHFPRLSKGDVVELRYRVEDVTPRNELSDSFGEVEYLGSDEPVASNEYVLITPRARPFAINTQSLPTLKRETKETADQRIDRFWIDDMPALAPEPNMPPWGEVLGHVHASTFKSWEQLGAYYWGLSRDQFDVDDEVRRRVKEITKNAKTDADKVRAVYKYATETRYVALEFGLEGIRPRRCAQTLARGWGDCKDKATLIVTMLRELGIPSTIVVVRTGMRGLIESTPASFAPFDHAIAYVPSLDLYLDGTAEHTGSTELPVMDRGAIALQINEGKSKLVRLPQPPAEASVTRRKLEVNVAQDGTGQFALEMQVAGAYAPEWRSRYLAEGTRRDRATRDLAGEIGAIELAGGKGGLELNDLDDEEQPVKLRARGKANVFARRDGDALSFPAGPAHQLVADYASLSTRKLDIELHALSQREDEWTIRLPAGVHVTRRPAPAALDTPYGRFSFGFEEQAGKIVVRTLLSFKKTRITPAEYPAWRAFCEAVDRAFGQRVVVSK